MTGKKIAAARRVSLRAFFSWRAAGRFAPESSLSGLLGAALIAVTAVSGPVLTGGAIIAGAGIGGAARAEQLCSDLRLDIRPGADLPAGSSRPPQSSFIVEIADTAESRAQGLMYRKDMAADAGMLFIYPSPRRAEFWMKNTLIPLDIIFADRRGEVTAVHENAIPGDLTPIPGGDNVQFVLEINAGLARRLGIVPGSQMRHPRIGNAHWSCD